MKTIAKRTRKQLGDLLCEHIAFANSEDLGRLIDAIDAEFTVTRRQEIDQRPAQPRPAKGQTWRNRESGRLVKVVDVGRGRGDVRWECVDGSRGPKLGRVHWWYWGSRFDFEGEAR